MKRLTKTISMILSILTVLPLVCMAYTDRVVANPPISMNYATPVVDGEIDYSNYSDAAYFSQETVGHFWATNPLTASAELYFAYDDNGLYFAADITDNDASSGFYPSNAYDNINNEGSSKPYGFNGDVMTLMLDALGVFEKTTYSKTPWYNIGIFADQSVKVYRSQANEGDITSKCSAKGKITEKGWRFEVMIPWSEIISDVSAASSSNLSVNKSNLTAKNSVTRAAVMYMDRTATVTWGRYITVCENTFDGLNGCHTNGVAPKAYGISLVNAGVIHRHIFGEWVRVKNPDCVNVGYDERACSLCDETEKRTVAALGHRNYYYETQNPSCITEGKNDCFCGVCNELVLSTSIDALGHNLGEWTAFTSPTATTHGIEKRFCDRCDYFEQRTVSALNAPEITTQNYTVNVTDADNIEVIRYAIGTYTTAKEIKSAAGCKTLDSDIIKKSTKDGIFVRELKDGGIYTFWFKMKDGNTYIVNADLSYMECEVSSNGVIITMKNLYGVKDIFIAEGNYTTYRFININKIVALSSNKLGTNHSYSYTVKNPGIHSICVRYKDAARPDKILHIELTVTEPTFFSTGMRIQVGNLEGARVIRTAYGDYSTPGEIKRAQGSRNYTSSAFKNNEFNFNYPNEGLITTSVEYYNGYCKIYQFKAKKREPVIDVTLNSVTVSGLDDLYVVRFAKGVFSTPAEIKANGGIVRRKTDITDGKLVFSSLEEKTAYTVMVQYNDNTKNIVNIITSDTPLDDNIISIGSERQLILEDENIIDKSKTTASIDYCSPIKKSVVFKFNKGYENRDTVYQNIVTLPDGSYRMYYKATESTGKRRICYIESKDGINWTRPSLSTNKYGNANSNIVTDDSNSPDNLFVFYDTNPDCPENQRWKGIYGQWGDGLFLEFSKDGNHFAFGNNEVKIMGTPTETNGCFFDSLNTVYWDASKGKYVAFVRGFHYGNDYNLTKDFVEDNGSVITRDIRYSESSDCINWSIPVPLKYDSDEDWQMYTNAVTPYFRSSGLYIGMPTRFTFMGENVTPLVDVFLMSSRDLKSWNRSELPYLTPNGEGTSYEYGDSGYPGIGFIQTADNEISFYMKEFDKSLNYTVLYRYTLRTDGFKRAFGNSENSILTTKYMTYEGQNLDVNFKTEKGGAVRVTATDIYGNKISSNWFSGDETDFRVSFDKLLLSLSSKTISLTFELNKAELYSFKFS